MSENVLLVTGGTGALGNGIVEALLSLNWEIWLVVLPGEKVQNCNSSVVLIEWDLSEEKPISKGIDFSRVNRVLHMAGVILSPEKERFKEVNLEGVKNLLRELHPNQIKHFVLISSISVQYPKRTNYGESKWLAEEEIKKSGLPYSIVRPSLLVDKRGGAEYNLFLKYLERSPVVLLPKGVDCLKNPIHINDLQRNLCQLLKEEGDSRTHVFGGGEELSLLEIAKLSLEGMKLKKRVLCVPNQCFYPFLHLYSAWPWKSMDPWQGWAGLVNEAIASEKNKDLRFESRAFREFVGELFPRIK